MFALDEELVRWQAELSEAHGSSRLPRLTALAWHLRQRDPLRAQTLSAEIAPLLAMLPVAEAALQRARLLLIGAEAEWLNGQLDTAQYQAEQALQQLEQAAALPARANRARADACWVLAWVANDRGDSGVGDRWLEQAALAARAGGDPVRIDVIDAASGICDTFSDWKAAQQRWHGRFGTDLADNDKRALIEYMKTF